jgi:outer membrane immunogenic protein
MKRLTIMACAGLLAAAMVSPSLAADLGPRPVYKGPAYVAPIFTWSGFYVGINAGYGFGESYWDPGNGTFDTKGWLAGGTLGYNIQTGNFVWGIEGDFDWSNMKGDKGVLETSVPWFATVRGRIGYAFDRFLPYFTGGAAIGEVKMDTGAGTDKETRIGWTVGGGLEWAFLANWSAKIEYLYADLGEASCTIAACGAGSDVSFRTNIVRGGVNYRF